MFILGSLIIGRGEGRVGGRGGAGVEIRRRGGGAILLTLYFLQQSYVFSNENHSVTV